MRLRATPIPIDGYDMRQTVSIVSGHARHQAGGAAYRWELWPVVVVPGGC